MSLTTMAQKDEPGTHDDSNVASVPPDVALQRLMGANVHAAILTAAVRLELGERLAGGPKSTPELAAAIGADADSLGRFLRAAVTYEVVVVGDDGRFSSTPLLDHATTPAIRSLLLMLGDDWRLRCWGELDWCVRDGRPAMYKLYGAPLFEFLAVNPEPARHFNAIMTAVSQRDSVAVAEAYDFTGARRIVDVGGGMGTLLGAILERNPEARGVLFEMPYVVEGARSSPSLAKVMDRCELVGGSFFETVPPGADVYVMKHIIHDWDDERALTIHVNCRLALGATGKLLVVDRVYDLKNPYHAFMDMEMLSCAGGRERTRPQWDELARRAGLKIEGIKPTPHDVSVLEMTPL